MSSDIGVVIVTYNRLEELQKTLRLFDEQSLPPAYLIVVDNASTDGTGDILVQWAAQTDSRYKRILLTNETNEGGSGGFYRGLERAVQENAAWIWVSDDDAYPFQNTIQKAQEYLDSIRENWSGYSAVCAGVLTEGGWNINHRRLLQCRNGKIVSTAIPAERYNDPSFELNMFSYVGAIINKEKLKQVGLTKKEYFIYSDDSEHSLRLSKAGKIVCVPSSRVYHYDPTEEKGPKYRWKIYYRIRNQYDMYRLHMPRSVYLRYYTGLYRRTLLQLLRNRNDIEAKITKCALDDLRNRKFGKHPLYYPGSNIE